jgi:hypothetical protein
LRYLVKTEPIHMTVRDTSKADGQTYDGFANFAVVMYDPGERPRAKQGLEERHNAERTHPLAYWRARYGTPFLVPPPDDLAHAMPPQLVPESALQNVPPGAQIVIRWHFVPSDKWFEAEDV